MPFKDSVKKYKKIPTEHDVILFNGKNNADIEEWSKGKVKTVKGKLTIETLEGDMTASNGDWIIKGVNGEFWAIKPDIFEKSYEKVEELEEADFSTVAPTSIATGQVPQYSGLFRRNMTDKIKNYLKDY